MRIRTWAIGLTLGMCVLVGAGPAHADELSGNDGPGDVTYLDFSQGGGSTLVPEHRNIDITRYVVRYGSQRIRIVLHFRDLNRRQPVLIIQGRLRWADDIQLNYGEATATATATRENPAGTARLTAGIRCDVQHHVGYASNRVVLSFPARCIGLPRWIQFNAIALTTDGLRDFSYWYVDDIYPVLSSPGDVERYSRRIHRS